MATIGDIKAGLSAGTREADRALAQLSGVADQVDKAIAVLAATAGNSGQPSVAQAVAQLTQAKQRFAEGATSIRAAIQVTNDYNSRL